MQCTESSNSLVHIWFEQQGPWNKVTTSTYNTTMYHHKKHLTEIENPTLTFSNYELDKKCMQLCKLTSTQATNKQIKSAAIKCVIKWFPRQISRSTCYKYACTNSHILRLMHKHFAGKFNITHSQRHQMFTRATHFGQHHSARGNSDNGWIKQLLWYVELQPSHTSISSVPQPRPQAWHTAPATYVQHSIVLCSTSPMSE